MKKSGDFLHSTAKSGDFAERHGASIPGLKGAQ
jgi:hypothetical protein